MRARKGPALVHATRDPAVLALAVGRREAVQDAGGARGRGAARSDRPLRASSSERTASPPTTSWPTLAARGRARGQRGRRAGARRADRAKTPPTLLRLLAGRRSDVGGVRHAGAPEGKPDTMVEAIKLTLHEEMARDERILVFGEDVADATARTRSPRSRARAACSARTACSGFGDAACFNTPLAEANIVGRAVGRRCAGCGRSPRSSSSTTSGRR